MESNCPPDKNSEELNNSKENINHCNNLKKEKGDSSIELKPNKPSSKKTNEKNNKIKKSELCNNVTREDLQNLCDQLSAFNTRVQTAREIIHHRYDLPCELHEKLETEAEELHCLYIELREAAKDIETVRNQREALGKEKLTVDAELARLKANVINELEVIVSVYDSGMLERWEAVKAGHSTSAVENFLYDVKGKLEAMKNLQTLANQKLADLQNKEKRKENLLKKEKKRKNFQDRRSNQSWSNSTINNVSQTSLLIDADTRAIQERIVELLI